MFPSRIDSQNDRLDIMRVWLVKKLDSERNGLNDLCLSVVQKPAHLAEPLRRHEWLTGCVKHVNKTIVIGNLLILSPGFPPLYTVQAAFTAHGVPPK
jgi:hypothetical protein